MNYTTNNQEDLAHAIGSAIVIVILFMFAAWLECHVQF